MAYPKIDGTTTIVQDNWGFGVCWKAVTLYPQRTKSKPELNMVTVKMKRRDYDTLKDIEMEVVE